MGNAASRLKLVEENDVPALEQERERLGAVNRVAQHKAQVAALAFANLEDAPDFAAAKRLESERDDAVLTSRLTQRDVDNFDAKFGTLLHRARQDRLRARLNELRSKTGAEAYQRQRDRLGDLVANLRKDLKGAIVEFLDAVAAKENAAREAEAIMVELGQPERFGRTDVSAVARALVAPLRAPNWEHTGSGNIRFDVFTENGEPGSERFVLEISGPVGASK